MSDPILQPGTLVIASLYRPTRATPGIGVTCFTCKTETSREAVAAALASQMPALTANLPAILRPGPPVCLLMHIIAPGATGSAVTSTVAELDRAALRGHIVRDLLDALPHAVAELFGLIGSGEAAEPAVTFEFPAPVVH